MEWAQERNASYLPQTKPWNFGLSNRIIEYVDKYRNLKVDNKVLCNFMVLHFGAPQRGAGSAIQHPCRPVGQRRYIVGDGHSNTFIGDDAICILP